MAARAALLDVTNVCDYVRGLLPLDGAPLQPGDELSCAEVHGGCARGARGLARDAAWDSSAQRGRPAAHPGVARAAHI